ncbi:helix-turn-helix transcriptional regulator [Rhizobium ruizarguesonis]|uniref:helix-turn-helix transcriptional regulator n=1 Tax=Rhizobium ruizarguesonis TaxID=2081791 RepID=UPI0013E08036|nr:WYL domain-containing protein [Rhizobium ruizarguesonis]NEJ95413.1 WYL domain-containing protein [Rhizobium ruizarguesonis]
MAETVAGLKWGVERRLEFIEFRLFWEGGVNRSDIIDTFDVSVPQASKDLTLYQDRAPQNAVYDKSAKRYVASENFEPHFLKPDPNGYLSRLRSVAESIIDLSESWITQLPDTDIALTPRRDIDAGVLRTVLSAVRDRRSVDVRYQSMSKERPDPIWRRITPHAFGYDGFRWHVRAYCHVTDKFKDFLLPRILGIGELGEAGSAPQKDDLWQERFGVEIGPHPDLTASQKAVVAKDYGMEGGSAILTVRYAMLFYVLKRLGMLGDATKLPARSQHIVVVNRDETVAALKKANFAA